MGIIIHRLAGRQYARRASFLLAVAGVLASSSFAHAIDPNPPARTTAEQRVTSQVNDLRKQVTRVQDQIAQMKEELAALRDQKTQAQRALPAAK